MMKEEEEEEEEAEEEEEERGLEKHAASHRPYPFAHRDKKAVGVVAVATLAEEGEGKAEEVGLVAVVAAEGATRKSESGGCPPSLS
jgi:hypothetical protein